MKLLNKTKEDNQSEGIYGMTVRGIKKVFTLEPGKTVLVTAFVKVAQENLNSELIPIIFKEKVISGPNISARYRSMFISPK